MMAVWLLALGQTLIYAGVYYAFPALLLDLEAATGWSKPMLALGPTLSFVVMALLTPWTGRLVDRGHGVALLVGMPVLAAAGMAVLAVAGDPWVWLVGWGVIGVALAGCLYETCFAFLTLRLGVGARAAITRVTLVAGFAGTVAFPLGHYLGRVLGGQGALWPFAGLVLVAAGLNAVAGRLLRQGGARVVAPKAAPGILRIKLRTAEFWALAVGFGLIYLNHGILVTYVLVLFQDRGVGADVASLAAACIGPAQVAGRLVLMVNEARVVNLRANQLAIGGVLLASLLLFAAGAVPMLVFAVAVMQGAGIGLISILRPVLVAEVLGRRGFGAVSGAVAVAPILASAAAPSVGAVVLEGLGQGAVYTLLAVLAAGGLALGIWLQARVRTRSAAV